MKRAVRVRMDSGLYAWVRAYTKGMGLGETTEESIIYLVRKGIHEAIGSAALREAMMPHLPKRIRRAFGKD